MNLAGPDLIIVLLIVLVLFGAKRLPDLAKGIGQAVKEFQKARDGFTQELHPVANPDRPMEGQAIAIARTGPATAQPEAAYPVLPSV